MAKNEIQKTEPTAIQTIDPASPAGLMMQLMSGDGPFDVEGFGKMLEFQERHEANQAKKVYASDFALAQSDIAAVVKTKINPQTHSKYAGLDDVLETSKPVYTRHGFSVIFYEGKAEDAEDLRLCADVLHRAGHKETYHLDVPLDGKGIKGNANMTKIHGKASSLSYGRRYLLCMIWNIPTQDDDGNKPKEKPPTVRKPTEDEWAVIAAVCEAMACPTGMRPDPCKVAAVCFETWQIYPYSMERVGKVVGLLDAMDRPEMFVTDNRSDFEKEQGMPGDEDSVPDTKEEATAKAKFGEEVVELRYYCTKCDKEFEEFKIKGVCANTNCLSRDIIDRQAEKK